MTYRLTMPLPPSVNDQVRPGANGRLVKTQVAKSYAKAAAVVLAGIRPPLRPLEGGVRLTLVVVVPHLASDASNRVKLLEDALTGHAWHDDRQVVDLRILKLLAKGPAGLPRVEVLVEPADALQAELVASLLESQKRRVREQRRAGDGPPVRKVYAKGQMPKPQLGRAVPNVRPPSFCAVHPVKNPNCRACTP